MRAIDITGQQFGSWTAIQLIASGTTARRQYQCKCECGTIRAVRANDLRRGTSTSCGCAERIILNPRKRRSFAEVIEELSIPEPNSGCWLWLGASGGSNDNRPTYNDQLASRLSFQTFNGPLIDGLCICHRCNNAMCVNPEHLYQGTQLQNIQDMMRAGRHAKNNPIHLAAMRERGKALGHRSRT